MITYIKNSSQSPEQTENLNISFFQYENDQSQTDGTLSTRASKEEKRIKIQDKILLISEEMNMKNASELRNRILKELRDLYLEEIFPQTKKQKYLTKINLISPINFQSLIKKKVKEILKIVEIRDFCLDMDNLEIFNIFNFGVIFNQDKIDIYKSLKIFINSKRIKLGPLCIKNENNIFDMEYYWGDWNKEGKKEGFGIKIFQNGNFYFGTFQDDEMQGIGLLCFADQRTDKYLNFFGDEELRENDCFSSSLNSESLNQKERLKFDAFYSKQYMDLNSSRKRTQRINYEMNIEEFDYELIDQKQNQIFVRNLKEENLDYFVYLGNFQKGKFFGEGEIYHKTKGRFEGKFVNNKMF